MSEARTVCCEPANRACVCIHRSLYVYVLLADGYLDQSINRPLNLDIDIRSQAQAQTPFPEPLGEEGGLAWSGAGWTCIGRPFLQTDAHRESARMHRFPVFSIYFLYFVFCFQIAAKEGSDAGLLALLGSGCLVWFVRFARVVRFVRFVRFAQFAWFVRFVRFVRFIQFVWFAWFAWFVWFVRFVRFVYWLIGLCAFLRQDSPRDVPAN